MWYWLVRPLLFRLEPELAQTVALRALRLLPRFQRADIPRAGGVGVHLLGLEFPNRIGLAAGFDKSARHIDVLGRLGFGSIEVGTVTPRPQPGSPPPKLFRLVEDRALINRMGFNNDGVEAVVKRLEKRTYRGVCGINIGKNATTPLEQAARDYVQCLSTAYPVVDYVTVNISSPNTPGLRELQGAEALRDLLSKLTEIREQLSAQHRKSVPLLVKLAPDLDEPGLDSICEVLQESGVDGVVATNTTISRPDSLRSRHSQESGGLSGEPLHAMSVRIVRALRTRLGEGYPIVGVGGICSPQTARSMFEAGADLLQIYTGLIYEGPDLVARLQEVAAERTWHLAQ